MENNSKKILVLFVEPMLYILDLIHEVYERTPYEFQYVFCFDRLTGKDDLLLPENSLVCRGTKKERRAQIKGVFARFRPDFAIINGYVGCEQTAAIGCCRKRKVPYAIETDTPLHIPENRLKAAAKSGYLKYLLKHPLCYGFPGGTLQEENLRYYGIPEDKCFVMPMCVSTKRLRQEAERLPDQEVLKARHGLGGRDVFLFVGRLEPVKNVPVLLRAFQQYKQANPNAALVIVGDGAEADTLKKMAGSMQDVHFAGYVVFPGLAEYYKMADVFVLPSCYESWGLVVNEAQSLDLPVVVSSRVGCRKDLILEGQTGFVFADDDAEMLKTAMGKGLELRKPIISMANQWNHAEYLKRFVSAVEHICGNTTKNQTIH